MVGRGESPASAGVSLLCTGGLLCWGAPGKGVLATQTSRRQGFKCWAEEGLGWGGRGPPALGAGGILAAVDMRIPFCLSLELLPWI